MATKYQAIINRVPSCLEPIQYLTIFDNLADAIAYQTAAMEDAAEDYHFKVVELDRNNRPDRVMWARGAKAWGARQVNPEDWDGHE